MEQKDFIWKNKENILQVKQHTLAEGEMLPLLHFPLLEDIDFIEHCFTTREGGRSKGIYSSMNLSFTRGDEEQAVLTNYERLAQALGVKKAQFVTSHQTHTTNVRKVGREEMGFGVTKEREFEDVDGLITEEPGVVLSTFYADCVPLYFVDPIHKAIGLSHSGWRGTVGRMGLKTLEAMEEAFGTNPKDVYAAVGPSICQDCYEISRDVAEEFMQEFPTHKEKILKQKSQDKFHLDLWKCNEIVLTEAGILPEHLAVTNLCTCCNHKLLFSHRASMGKRGNLGAFLMIRE